MEEILSIVDEAISVAFRSAPTESIIEWCEKYIIVDKTSPFPGPWRLANSPWVGEPMLVWQDDQFNDESIMAAAQSSKTQTVICCGTWIIDAAPGPLMWVLAAADEAKTFMRVRLIPTFETCEPVVLRMPKNRFDRQVLEINFPHMPFIMNGANSPSKLQSKPIRYLILDELRNYPPGAYEMVMKRTRAFWNYKRLIISTPSKVNDAVHRAYLAGDQRRYFVKCPHCAGEFPLEWKQMKWDRNEKTNPEPGRWDFNLLAETIRYECPHCAGAIKDTPQVRRTLAASGRWIAQNKLAPSNRASFHWNAILPPWVRWKDLVEEFLTATGYARLGDLDPLKSFINESLGEPFDDSEDYLGDLERPPENSYSLVEIHEDDGDQRYFTVDVQQREFWGGVRAWWKDGATSKLLFPVNMKTWGDISEVAERFGLVGFKSRFVFVDARYDTYNVFGNCADNGWTALMGENRGMYIHTLPSKRKVRRIYSPLQKGDPHAGTKEAGRRWCSLFLFADDETKDMLDLRMRGLGPRWEIPRDPPPFYMRQLRAEVWRQKKLPSGEFVREWIRASRQNHMFDVEKMQIVAAALNGLMGAPVGRQSTEAEDIDTKTKP